MEQEDAVTGVVSDVDTNGLVIDGVTATGGGTINYSDVISYDATSITYLLATLNGETWWQQTDYYNDANGGLGGGNEYNAIQINTQNSHTVLPYNAVVQVSATDYALDGQEWNLKVGLKSTHSLDSSQIGSDDFILKLKDICWDIPTVAPTVDQA